ncbi:MAG: response regulator transcription factor [Gammaproteobacteria bacterium]|nr:response regulator transcription factor [Gammaproteobacteria bacterium]
MHLALLEDDPDQSAIMIEWLKHHGHQCDCFASGREFIKTVRRNTYDMLILDRLIPDMNGIEVLKWVRENMDWRIPVLITTQLDSEEDIVFGLNQGADDYMIKPIKNKELLARIDALGRRLLNQEESDSVIHADPFIIERKTRNIKRHDELIPTTNIEYDLALFMFQNYGRVLSRGYILENVWGRKADITTRTVDTHVSRIRKKLGIVPENNWQLVPIYQHGYRLEKLN